MSGLINKAKEAAKDALEKRENKNTNTGGPGGNQYDNPQSGNAGPHSSNIVNKVDPRVDSDRDGRNDPTSRTGGYGQTQDNFGAPGGAGYGAGAGAGAGAGHVGGPGHGGPGYGAGTVHDTTTQNVPHGAHGTHGAHGGTVGGAGYGSGPGTGGVGGAQYDDPRSGNAGPHSSNVLNKVDPRVDSDRDGRNDPTSRAGGYGNTQDTYGAGAGGAGGAGYGAAPGNTYGGNTGGIGGGHTGGIGGNQGFGGTGGVGGAQYDDPRSTNAGPHSSNVMNTVDPRVDSDRDGRNNPASHAGGYGNTQQQYGSGGGLAGTAPTGHQGHPGQHGHPGQQNFTPGSGDANRTAGPHDSNLLNKLDPRVDSDADGSKTYGGNRTNY